ncbi:MAG: YggU family protein [Nitrospirae bacterium]|nr:YggU family protein [Nitrospirota bacterium]
MEIPYSRTKDSRLVSVKVVPRSSKKGIAGIDGDVVKIKVTAPPVDGAANEQVIEIIAEAMNARKSDVDIIRGSASRTKTVRIKGV